MRIWHIAINDLLSNVITLHSFQDMHQSPKIFPVNSENSEEDYREQKYINFRYTVASLLRYTDLHGSYLIVDSSKNSDTIGIEGVVVKESSSAIYIYKMNMNTRGKCGIYSPMASEDDISKSKEETKRLRHAPHRNPRIKIIPKINTIFKCVIQTSFLGSINLEYLNLDLGGKEMSVLLHGNSLVNRCKPVKSRKSGKKVQHRSKKDVKYSIGSTNRDNYIDIGLRSYLFLD